MLVIPPSPPLPHKGGESRPSSRRDNRAALSLPPRSGGEGRPKRSAGQGGRRIDIPHPDAHFIRVFPPHHSLTLVGGGIKRPHTRTTILPFALEDSISR